jgi:hypothetical protein
VLDHQAPESRELALCERAVEGCAESHRPRAISRQSSESIVSLLLATHLQHTAHLTRGLTWVVSSQRPRCTRRSSDAASEETRSFLPPNRRGVQGTRRAQPAQQIAAALGGLTLGPHKEVLCIWDYPDEAALLKAFGSTALAVRAIRAVGEEAVTRAILKAVAPFRLSGGGYRLENVFVYAIARATGPAG